MPRARGLRPEAVKKVAMKAIDEPTKQVSYKPLPDVVTDKLKAALPQVSGIEILAERSEKLFLRGFHPTEGRVRIKALLPGAAPQRRERMIREIEAHRQLGESGCFPRLV